MTISKARKLGNFDGLTDQEFEEIRKQLNEVVQAVNDMELVPPEVPTGTIISFASSDAPIGYLKTNGAAVSRITYADLFAVIGETFGIGDGSTTFNLPDLRGEFIRGWDDSRGIDAARVLGSAQADQNKQHDHFVFNGDASTTALSNANYPACRRANASDSVNYNITGTNTTPINGKTSSSGGSENRPRNIALLACIKY